MENIDIDIDIDKDILENIDIDIDIDKEILENIDIDKISNRLEFGISNRATQTPSTHPYVICNQEVRVAIMITEERNLFNCS